MTSGERATPFDIAVIVPVYNVERYLEKCIDSILSQTYKPKQIILVDDGSTDASGSICDQYAESYDSITSLHKDNQGLGYARNSGLEAVNKEAHYIAFVDSDDWLDEDAFERLISATEGRYVDCVTAGYKKKSNEDITNYTLQLEDCEYDYETIRTNLMPRLFGSAPAAGDSLPMSVCNSLFKHRIIDENCLRFPSEKEALSEDFVFKYDFLLHSSHVVVSSSTSYCYRTNMRSLTNTYRPDRFEATKIFYNMGLRMIETAGLSNECLVRLKKTFLIYIRQCLKQEITHMQENGKSACYEKAERIINDELVRDIIYSYPIAELGWKQRAFTYMVMAGKTKWLIALGQARIF